MEALTKYKDQVRELLKRAISIEKLGSARKTRQREPRNRNRSFEKSEEALNRKKLPKELKLKLPILTLIYKSTGILWNY